MNKKPILLVMAAGMGSRYGGLKQIDPMGSHGEAILDYSLYDARSAGFETVVFIIKREIENDFRETVGARVSRSGMTVKYVYQDLNLLPKGYAVPEGRTKPWGTGHAVLSAALEIDAPFAVINADDYYGPAAFREIYNWLCTAQDTDKYHYAMVGFLLENTLSDNGSVSRGVCVTDADGYLETITERTRIEKTPTGAHYTEDDGETWTDLPGDTIVSMNLFGFTPYFTRELANGFIPFLRKALEENPMKAEYYLPSAVAALLADDRADVRVLTSTDKWYGVTYKEDKPVVQQAIRDKISAGQYPDDLWAVTTPDAALAPPEATPEAAPDEAPAAPAPVLSTATEIEKEISPMTTPDTTSAARTLELLEEQVSLQRQTRGTILFLGIAGLLLLAAIFVALLLLSNQLSQLSAGLDTALLKSALENTNNAMAQMQSFLDGLGTGLASLFGG